MKFANRTPLPLFAALACLAASVSWAGDVFQDETGFYRVNPPTSSRMNSRIVSQPTAAPEQVISPAPSLPAEHAMAMPDEHVEGGCDGGCSGGCDCDDCWSGGRCQSGLWYGGIDYLLVRPHFSQATAEVREFTVRDAAGNTTTTDQAVQFPFKSQSSFRAALGYRLLDCCGEVQVAYWRLTTAAAHVSDGPTSSLGSVPVGTPALSILGPLNSSPNGAVGGGDNQFFTANSGVTANIFDLDFAKSLAFGGPQNGCDCCCGCPRWDLRWSAGARFADVSRFYKNSYSDANSNTVAFTNIDSRFSGGGPRVGIQGRRYFGECGRFALFARASQSLLLGNFRENGTHVLLNTPTTVTDNAAYGFNRLVPVTDIELGGTLQVAPYAFVSIGWFVQCWWDLGQGETTTNTNTAPLDTANILGFDGLFIRGELLF